MPESALRTIPPSKDGHPLSLAEQAAQLAPWLDEGFTAQTPEGALVFANAQAAEILGCESVEALLATPLAKVLSRFELLDEDGRTVPLEHLPSRQALTGRLPPPKLLRFRIRRTREDRWAMLRAVPIFDAQHRVSGVFNFFRDVTDQRASERALSFLSHATSILGQSLDYESTLAAVANAAVPVIADWCGVDLAEPDGIHWKSVAVAHVNPEKVALARALNEKYPPDIHAPAGIPRALKTGEPEIVPEIPAEVLRAAARDPEHLRLIEELQLRSYVLMPLKARGKVIGTISLVFAESGRRFNEAYVRLAENLASAAAVAVDNARLYRDALALNERLKVALDAGRLGAWEWDLVGNRVNWSPEVEAIHGIPIGSFPGTLEAYRSDTHPDDVERVSAIIKRTLEAKKPDYDVMYRIIRPDGQVRWLEAHGRLLFDPSGAAVKLTGVCSDITDRVKTEETARALVAEQAERRTAEQGRAFTQDILESIDDPTYVLDANGLLLFANRAARTQTPIGEVAIGQSVFENGSALPEHRREQIEEVRRTHRPLVLEEPHGDRWNEIRLYPMRDGVTVSSRDVTARHQHEALQAELARHSMLRADVADALASGKGLEETLQLCTDAVVRHLQVSFVRIWSLNDEEQVLELRASSGKYTHKNGGHARVPVGHFKIGLIAKEKRPHLTNDVQTDPRVADKPWAKREGMVAFAGYPLMIGGEVLGVMALFDTRPLGAQVLQGLASIADVISQGMMRQKAEAEREAHARDLARSNAELQQFAYVASHDLQEPLRMVASYTQLLGRRYKGKLDQDADDFIHYAVDGVTRMQTLINDLLAYSRVGTHGREFGPISLEQVLEDASSNLQISIEQSGAQVSWDPLPTVWGDRGQLTQLMQNLIGNAVKFRRDEPPRIHLTAKREGERWHVQVKDNGIGISPEYFDRVFVIFQRLHTRNEYPGNGIGLAICKKIVERHGGRIWAESSPGNGSTFHLTLASAESKGVE